MMDWLWMLPNRLALMPTANAAIFVICAVSLIPTGAVMLLATHTAWLRYPVSIGRWAAVKPTSPAARQVWLTRGRKAWSAVFALFAVNVFTLYLLWWCWTYVSVPLPRAGIVVHSVRLLSGLYLAWAFAPGGLRGRHD